MTDHQLPAGSRPSPPAGVERSGYGAFDHALHGGQGRTTVQYHFADRMSLPVAVQTWTLEPGASEGAHAHPDPPLEEFYLVISGTATLRLEGHEHVLSAGDSALCRPEAEHELTNTGTEDLRVLVVWGPPGTADFTGYATYRKAVAARQT